MDAPGMERQGGRRVWRRGSVGGFGWIVGRVAKAAEKTVKKGMTG